jgi:hypothetical protein
LRSATVVDEAELARLARLVARLSPAQQRLMVALADGFRGGWLEPVQWERAWRGSDLSDDGVLGDGRTWLARRPQRSPSLPGRLTGGRDPGQLASGRCGSSRSRRLGDRRLAAVWATSTRARVVTAARSVHPRTGTAVKVNARATEQGADRRGDPERMAVGRSPLPRGRCAGQPEHADLASLCGQELLLAQALASQRWQIVGGADLAGAGVQHPDRSLLQPQRPVEAGASGEQLQQASELLSVPA